MPELPPSDTSDATTTHTKPSDSPGSDTQAGGTKTPATASTGLETLSADATGAEAWAALGAAGLLTRAYQGGEIRDGIDPGGLADLLAASDSRCSIPATLSASVQLATALPLLATGTGPAVERTLRRVLTGRATLALAATDTTAGTDLTALRTEVVLDDGSLTVSGGKEWIANTTTAEAFLVLARHRPGRHFTNFSWILVPADAPGVTTRPAPSTLYASSGVGHVTFDAVRLDRAHIVGRVGLGLPLFARHIAVERLAGALWGVALCRRVLEATRHHLAERAHGDVTLWHLPHIRQRFASCLVRVQELQSLADRFGPDVAQRHDPRAAATLKAAAGTTVPYVLGECAHLWGAAGFTDGGIQEIRAQAALFGIGGGATEIVLETLADSAGQILEELARPTLQPEWPSGFRVPAGAR
ncbi:acyl-CoA dehydrogenase family protein [Streptomyces sp. NPDC060011]|uniref:acyl-CoA dehydrogenase family protein n=1 Tax=Streptomyces sp. NPDC060011 TaxID=3347037 RepID=UPI0036AC79F3